MRESVGRRGATGSTFDQVAGEAGVSRGLLHYYFGSKERLMAEVVRHDCDIRLARLDEALGGAMTWTPWSRCWSAASRTWSSATPAPTR